MVISERIRVPPRYRLLEQVGQGGMAIVYRAHDESLKREVAIKVLHPHLSAEPESKARLEREAQAVAKLKHDNILEIFDYSGGDADSAYIVTEFIDGQTLKQFLGGQRIKHPEVAALIVAELGTALTHAHELGIIHRDVKPENVMIRKDGLLKLMDFGIAQVLDLERMTVTGQLLGSPAYMAPELIEGRPLDVRTDVFSVGILLYQMATGTLPFSGKNPHEVLRRITEGRFADARGLNRLCGAGLCRIIARALARDPADRYSEMRGLVADLRELLAEAGLGDVRAELRDYFRDPDAYEQALATRMTPALTASAQRYLTERTAARAIECWNRVLAYAPQNAVVLAALRRFEGRSRRRLVGLYALGSLTAGALLFGLVKVLANGSAGVPIPTGPPPALAASNVASAVPAPIPSGAKPHPLTNLSADARAARALRPRATPAPGRPDSADPSAAIDVPDVEAPATLPPPDRIFALGPTPQNVDVYLDGERQFSYDTDHRSLTVPWQGTHVIEFRSPSGCCFPERLDVGPDRPAPPDNIIARKLKWKPARLVVTISPFGREGPHHGAGSQPPRRRHRRRTGRRGQYSIFPKRRGTKGDRHLSRHRGGIARRTCHRAGRRATIHRSGTGEGLRDCSRLVAAAIDLAGHRAGVGQPQR